MAMQCKPDCSVYMHYLTLRFVDYLVPATVPTHDTCLLQLTLYLAFSI